MTIFAARGQRMKVLLDGNSIAKKWKFENFEQNRFYIPQKNATNMLNSDSSRNSLIFWKKKNIWYNTLYLNGKNL